MIVDKVARRALIVQREKARKLSAAQRRVWQERKQRERDSFDSVSDDEQFESGGAPDADLDGLEL